MSIWQGDDSKLMKNNIIQKIVTQVTRVIQGFDEKFEVVNVNVLHGKVHGKL